jgi:hypothetical protein
MNDSILTNERLIPLGTFFGVFTGRAMFNRAIDRGSWGDHQPAGRE